MKPIFLIRLKHQNIGGAQSYITRLSKALDESKIDNKILSKDSTESSFYDKILPRFLAPLLFSYKLCKSKNDRAIYFSLERLACADIYRAGDGVHRRWLEIKRANLTPFKRVFSYFKPIDIVLLYLELLTFKNSKKIIANSQMVKEEIIRTFDVEPSKIDVVYNGFDAPAFSKEEDKRKVCALLNIPQNSKIVLFVGNGFFRKGLRLFLEIVAKLEQKNYVALVVGRDREQKKYEKLAKNNPNVLFLGEQKDVFPLYSASDIFLFPTLYEPFSNACLEALAFGNVVFTTKNNGFSEIMKDASCIIDTIKTTAKDIDALLGDEAALKRAQNDSVESAKRFNMNSNIAKTLKAIREI